VSNDSEYKLKIRDVRKTYGPVVALTDADVDMREGEFLTLLGPSGSGKSTLLWAIAGLNDPDSGEIWIDGKLVKVLETVELPHVADRLPRELSGGQQQRIALARCFVYAPSIILMDEPLGALDKKLRDHLQREIKHLHEKLGITVMYVTHDQEEAMVMSDRICLMNNARMEQLGTPDDLYFRPATIFAADFLGESNLIDATVEETNGEATVLAGPTDVPIRAVPNDKVSRGEKVKFMVRPECVQVMNGADNADNTVEGVLKEVIMTGHVTKLFVDLPSGEEVVSTTLTRGSITEIPTGDTVRLGWPQDRTVALKNTGGAA
jgi:putative spermidine/putrescine transport system ATP-binding protein